MVTTIGAFLFHWAVESGARDEGDSPSRASSSYRFLGQLFGCGFAVPELTQLLKKSEVKIGLAIFVEPVITQFSLN
jgi:hypothetical protein